MEPFPTWIVMITEWLGVIAVAWLLSATPRFQKRTVGFRYARRDGMVALTVSIVLVLIGWIFASSNLGKGLWELIRLPEAARALNPLFILAMLSLLIVLAALFLRGQPLKGAGWDSMNLRLGLQTGLALALLTLFLRNRVMDVLNGLSREEITYLLVVLGIALAEETVFRGYVQMRLCWWLGEKQGILATAAFNTLWRLPLLLAVGASSSFWMSLGMMLGQALLSGWLMQKTGSVLTTVLYRATSLWMNFYP